MVERSNTLPDWEQRYKTENVEQMPWFYPALDPDVEAALQRFPVSGRALDVGTGPGTQAIALAQRGFEVLATDLAPEAVRLAEKRAAEAGVSVVFRVDDVLASTLTETFELILDRGCFHVLEPGQRPIYLRWIRDRALHGSLLFLKCFSTEEPGEHGPKRFTREQIEELFSADFEILSIEPTIYQGTLDPMPKALFSVLRAR